MNKSLIERLAAELNCQTDALRAQAAYGGDINQAFRLTDGNRSWFVKVNADRYIAMFEAEQRGLQQIAAAGSIRVPQAISTGQCAGQCYLLLEYIAMHGQPDARALAAALAGMHQYTDGSFGNDYDNTIGLTPQINTREHNWVEFWRKHRIGWQIQLGSQRGLDSGLLDKLGALQSAVDGFFHDYQPTPALLHGDLWSGNWSADASGAAVVYDPACYFGDHEADLAMMELFGNPGEAFFSAYHEHFAIDPGYPVRKQLYNLYHIVNHALLFGGGYAGQASRMADRLLAELR